MEPRGRRHAREPAFESRGGLIRTSHNPPNDVAHAPTSAVSRRLFSTLRLAVAQRSEPERRQQRHRAGAAPSGRETGGGPAATGSVVLIGFLESSDAARSACATSLPKKSGEKCAAHAETTRWAESEHAGRKHIAAAAASPNANQRARFMVFSKEPDARFHRGTRAEQSTAPSGSWAGLGGVRYTLFATASSPWWKSPAGHRAANR